MLISDFSLLLFLLFLMFPFAELVKKLCLHYICHTFPVQNVGAGTEV
jgi:hypothetical protein